MTKPKDPTKITANSKKDALRGPKQEPTTTCNAWAKSKYCTQTAGWGTSHAGSGRCKLHGGSSQGAPKKTFSASKYLNSELLNTIHDTADLDPNAVLKLDDEIHLIRTGLYGYAKQCISRKEPLKAVELKEFINPLVKLVEAKAKLEGKITNQKVPMEIIVLYVNQVTGILKQICPPDMLQTISHRMKGIKIEGLDGSGSEQDSAKFN